MGTKVVMLSGFAGILAGASYPAMAQELAVEEATSETRATPQVHDASEMGQIVVTARRRQESLQDVPVAITALSAEDLREKNLGSPVDLQRVAPGLQIRANGATRSDVGFFIRGQGSTYGSQPGVIAYFNEVPEYRSPLGNNIQFYDIDSIQVLKGPQGTLFGRSTTGGAVLITAKRPTNEFEGFIEGKVGNYQMRELTGAINIPVVDDVLALRFAGNLMRRDGYTRGLITGERLDNRKRESYRISALFTPSPEFEMLTMFRGARYDENATGVVLVDHDENHPRFQPATYGAIINQICTGFNPGNPANRASCVQTRTERMQALLASLQQEEARVRNGDKIDESQIRRNAGSTDTFIRGEVQQLSNVITVRPLDLGPIFGELQIKNIFATNRVVRSSVNRLVAGAPLLHADTCSSSSCDLVGGELIAPSYASKRDFFDNFSNEFQLSGSSRVLDWVAGWYYNREEVPIQYPVFFATYNTAFNTTTPLGIGNVNSRFAINEKAVDEGYYGQATVRPVEELSVTAGYRFSEYTRTALSALARVTPEGLKPTDITEAVPVNDSASSYNFSVDYQFTPDLLVYVTHRKGFKPGGANQVPAVIPEGFKVSFRPETVKDYEFGVKYSWRTPGFNGRAALAVFRTDYSDIQRNEVLPVPGGTTITQVNNIAAAKIEGVELETLFNIGSRFSLGVNYAYTNARYTAFPGTTTGIDGVVRNNIDTPFVGTPKHSGSVNVRYTVFDTSAGHLSVSGNVYAQSGAHVHDAALETPLRFGKQSGYAHIGGRIEWADMFGKPIDASLFVTNLTNEVHVDSIAGLDAALGIQGAIFNEPRMYGMGLRFRF